MRKTIGRLVLKQKREGSHLPLFTRRVRPHARAEIAVLNSVAPDFLGSVFRGENPVFIRGEDMQHLLAGLRLAGLPIMQ